MSMLKQACITANEKFLMSIPEVLPEPVYSKKHIRIINKLKNKMRNDRYHQFTTGTVKVMLVAAIILSLIVTTFAIPTTREYIIKQLERYSVFQVVDTDNAQDVDGITLGYIPEGFELTENDQTQWVFASIYSNNNGDWFVLEKTKNATTTRFDTETYEYKTTVINNIEFVIYKTPATAIGIVWNNNNYTYKIDGNISEEEMLKIAQNIT